MNSELMNSLGQGTRLELFDDTCLFVSMSSCISLELCVMMYYQILYIISNELFDLVVKITLFSNVCEKKKLKFNLRKKLFGGN